MKHSDWEGQRERLSAYLDDEMVPAERSALETHLADCTECQAELAALRQMRALLRALPTPTPPRAFTLPPSASSPLAPTTPRRGRVVYPRWARPAQALGGVAAVIGLGLLVTTALPAMPSLAPHIGGAASSAGAATYAPVGTDQHAVAATSSPATAQANTSLPQAAIAQTATAQTTMAQDATAQTKTAQATATAVATASPAPATAPYGTQTSAPRTPVNHTLVFSAPPAPVSGGLLLIGGAAAITAGGAARRRARRDGVRALTERAG